MIDEESERQGTKELHWISNIKTGCYNQTRSTPEVYMNPRQIIGANLCFQNHSIDCRYGPLVIIDTEHEREIKETGNKKIRIALYIPKKRVGDTIGITIGHGSVTLEQALDLADKTTNWQEVD